MAEDTPAKTLMSADIARIMKLLPHRYPFLLIDRMIDMDGEESGTGDQERHHQRALLPGPFSRQARDAGRACWSKPWPRPRAPWC